MRRLAVPLAAAALLVGTVPAPAGAAPGAEPFKHRLTVAKRTSTPPVIDGDITDACWADAPSAQTFVDFQNGNVVADQTVAKLLYDDKSIYVAFYCKESRPEAIQARETVQDSKYLNAFQNGNGIQNNEDNVEFTINPFNSHKQLDISYFSVNAIGTKSALPAGGRANKVEWHGIWDAAVKRVADGWTAEMRIPWAALNYPAVSHPLNMEINFNRYQFHTQLLSTWSWLGTEGFIVNDGEWDHVAPAQRRFEPHVSLLPYVLARNDGYRPVAKTGVDIRYTPTPQLTAVGTINPEFGTVEGALASIQFSRSEIIAPESRPFFLEGNEYFSTSNVQINGSLFFSGRVPGFDLGEKVYGKVAPTDSLGFLHTTSFGHRDDLAVRYRHDFTATSQLGVYVGNLASKDDHNGVVALLQNSRNGKLVEDAEVWLSSGINAGGDAKQFVLLWADGVSLWGLGYGEVSPGFRDADGYVPFNDSRQFIGLFQYNPQWRHGFWRSLSVNATPTYSWHYDGRVFAPGYQWQVGLTARKDWLIQVMGNYDTFDGSLDNTLGFEFMQQVSNRLRQWGIIAQSGTNADMPSSFVGPFFSYRIFKHLDVGYAGSIQNLGGVTQQHILTMNWEFSPTRATGGRFVLQNGYTNAYLYYRNSGGRGTNYYVVLGDPNAQKFVETLQVKVVWSL